MGQFKSGDTILSAGYAFKDAEFKRVGDNQTPICEFAIVTGKLADGKSEFANCKAWRDLAVTASRIKKGDSVCVVGRLESREYNGKTYTSVVADWLGVVEAGLAQPTAIAPKQSSFQELPDDESDLPF